MLEGLWPALHHVSHSFLLLRLSPRAIARAAVNGSSMVLRDIRALYPSQSGIEIQPSSRYIMYGLAGMLKGRCPDVLHAFHALTPSSLSLRTMTLAAANGSMVLRLAFRLVTPSQSGIEIQPSSRYITCGLAGMLKGRCPDLLHSLHSGRVFIWSFRAIALATSNGSMAPPFHPFSTSFTATRGTRCVVSRPRAGIRSLGSTSVSEHMRSMAWCNIGSYVRGGGTRRNRPVQTGLATSCAARLR